MKYCLTCNELRKQNIYNWLIESYHIWTVDVFKHFVTDMSSHQ